MPPGSARTRRLRAFIIRTVLLFGFWLLLLEPESVAPAAIGIDWAVGALAALAAAALSLRLLPPARRALRLWPLLRYLLRFLVQSLLAGLDVARRALDPRLPVHPSLLQRPTALPPGTSRTLFGALSSQMPGTLTVDLEKPERLLYHCLDRPDRAAWGLAADEALFCELLGQGAARGGRPPA